MYMCFFEPWFSGFSFCLNRGFQDFRIFRIREEGVGEGIRVCMYTRIRVYTFRPAGAWSIEALRVLDTFRTAGAEEVAILQDGRGMDGFNST